MSGLTPEERAELWRADDSWPYDPEHAQPWDGWPMLAVVDRILAEHERAAGLHAVREVELAILAEAFEVATTGQPVTVPLASIKRAIGWTRTRLTTRADRIEGGE